MIPVVCGCVRWGTLIHVHVSEHTYTIKPKHVHTVYNLETVLITIFTYIQEMFPTRIEEVSY